MHDINLALSLSPNLLIMKNGCIEAHGEASEIVTRGVLEKAYEVDVVKHMRESLAIWEGIRE
jgi:iron complex transport system ATP-binding protein